MTTVAIVGSRAYPLKNIVVDVVYAIPGDSVVISGGAKGPDTWGIDTAKERGMETRVYYAYWETYGKAAGMIRNVTIVKQCDVLIAFWDGKIPGTLDVARKAHKAGKLAFLYDAGGQLLDPNDLFGREKAEAEPNLFGEEEAGAQATRS